MKKLSVLFLFFAVFSCIVMDKTGGVNEEKYKDILNSLPEQICVFDPAQFYAATPQTKAASVSPVVLMPENMDFEKAKFYSTEEYDYTQIPIEAEGLPGKTVLRFPGIELGDSPFSAPGTAKTYLIVQDSRGDSCRRVVNVVMIVPQPKYMTQEQLDSVDFFYDGNLNGAIFYSDVSGKILKVETVINGKMYRRGYVPKMISAADTALAAIWVRDKMSDGNPIAVPSSEDDPEELNPIYVVADGPDSDWNDWNSNDPDHPSNNRGDDLNEAEDEVQNPNVGLGGGKKQIEVRVSVVGRGYSTGTGYYDIGSVVHCSASPMYYADTPVSTFVGWSGYMTSASSSVTFTVTGVVADYSLTATFHNLAPCSDGEYRDPLMDMKILGTQGSGIDGGRFGKTRSGGSREHRGIDLDCPIGTPVFATISGRVSNTISNLINNESWPQYHEKGGQLGRKTFNCGNRIYITGKIAGQTVTVVYFHLQNLFVKDGDVVEAGDIIGQSGNSGSASDSTCAGPHLHYQVQIWRNDSTVYLNPEDYIYSILDDDGMQTNPCN